MSKTTYKRADRVADQIRMEVADILMRKIKDPRVHDVTVTDVELTGDLRIAHVFVTTMERGEGEREVFAGLSKASGFVRAELGRRLSLRYLPDIIFKKDVSGIRGDRIHQLLAGLHGDVEPRPLQDDPSKEPSASGS
ncbi:MAG: 30S ribosome-binding factor RbfA [Nitrospira sp.]|nr:30S ribosome-binding factor RbfA [Nitrospira sp.]MBS0155454.1 30S ribosome-binding factor RbfA [Nitrospira sp.]MBS0167898.1 30S ribosome-binding factor RbfA [Nitrospira sp.]MBX3325382.1 30S ribosome-binding factor RbfA [Nitrospira sp.]